MTKARSKPAPVPSTLPRRGRPPKDPMAPRVEASMAVGCTYEERARFKASALAVKKRSLSNYLRELIGLETIT